jgi:hypothetical protein
MINKKLDKCKSPIKSNSENKFMRKGPKVHLKKTKVWKKLIYKRVYLKIYFSKITNQIKENTKNNFSIKLDKKKLRIKKKNLK